MPKAVKFTERDVQRWISRNMDCIIKLKVGQGFLFAFPPEDRRAIAIQALKKGDRRV